jgi:hypothetical protein
MKYFIQILSDNNGYVDYSDAYDHKSAAGKRMAVIQQLTAGHGFNYRLVAKAQ